MVISRREKSTFSQANLDLEFFGHISSGLIPAKASSAKLAKTDGFCGRFLKIFSTSSTDNISGGVSSFFTFSMDILTVGLIVRNPSLTKYLKKVFRRIRKCSCTEILSFEFISTLSFFSVIDPIGYVSPKLFSNQPR